MQFDVQHGLLRQSLCNPLYNDLTLAKEQIQLLGRGIVEEG